MVALGATLQMTTGVGLGLIAGPFLLFVMDPASAIRTAIVLNLLLSVIPLPWEWRHVEFAPLARLTGWATNGIPLGSVFRISVNGGTLKLVSGGAVLAAALQLTSTKVRQPSPARHGRVVGIDGFVSGLMTGARPIPGPVALWALLSSELEPHAIRATLRAFFVVAYSLAYVTHSFLTGLNTEALSASMTLSPAVLLGMVIGVFMRRRFSPVRLARLLELLLFLMGASLVIKGIGFFG